MNVLRIPVLSLLFAACQAQPTDSVSAPREGDASRPLHWSGYYGGRSQFAVVPLRDAQAWDAFWRGVQREKPQPLDPAREMAVAVFLGQRNTGGYGVEIVRVRPDGPKLVVEYRETTPPPDAMVTQALTTPWTVAIVPRSELPLEPRKIVTGDQRQRK